MKMKCSAILLLSLILVGIISSDARSEKDINERIAEYNAARDLPIPKWGEVSQDEWDLQPPEDYPEANAVKIFDFEQLEITFDGIVETHHVRWKVFNDAGAKDVGDITIDYQDGDKLKNLKAHTITPDKVEHKLNDNNFYEQKSEDDRSKTFSFPSVEPGSILEYQYENHNTRFGFLDFWFFQSDVYTMKSVYVVDLAPGFTYSTISTNVPYYQRDPVEYEGKAKNDKCFKWTCTNLPAITTEPYMSAVSDYLSSIYVELSEYKGNGIKIKFKKEWGELGEAATKVVDSYAGNGKDIKKLVATITDTSSAKQESRARTIYRYVCDSIKTKGPGGNLASGSLKDIIKQRYGSSNDKNILLTEMLKQAGIDAWPVWISTRDNGAFKPQVYQIAQLNHIITYAVVDSVGLFLDASTRYCPYGTLPPNSMSNGGVILDGENSEPIRIFTVIPNSQRKDITEMTIDSNGDVSCSTSVALSGFFMSSYGALYEAEEPDSFVIDRFLDKMSDDFKLGTYTFVVDTDGFECQLDMNYTVNDGAETLDRNVLVSPLVSLFRTNPFTLKKREFPVDFQYPFTYENIVKIHCTDSATLIQKPPDTSFFIDGAKYLYNITVDGSTVTVYSKLILERPQFISKQYADLRQFFVNIEEVNQQQVTFERSGQ